MSPHQDFDAPDGAKAKSSGTLTLGGRKWSIRHRDDVPFEIVKRLMSQDPLSDNASEEEKAKAAREVVMQTGPFFNATIVPDEVEDFMAMLSDDNSPMTIGKLKPVMEYVSGVVFSDADERPTKPSKPSQLGRSKTGAISEGSSSSRATAQRASAG